MIQVFIQELKERQSWDLEKKVKFSLERIKAWENHWKGKTRISFSGGKDSTVVLDLVRTIVKDKLAVFDNSGMEYSEVREFVKSFKNIQTIRPKKNFKYVIENYGWPIISKKIAREIEGYRNTKSNLQRELKLYGGINPTTGRNQQISIPKRYRYLINSDIKISAKCCDVLKKEPFKTFDKRYGLVPYTGVMASESEYRMRGYLKNGCNMYNLETPISSPIMFWREKDVWDYIKSRKLKYCNIYDKGIKRTGCLFCSFGIMYDKNRFVNLKKTHPKMYNYFINKLNMKKVLDIIGVKY